MKKIKQKKKKINLYLLILAIVLFVATSYFAYLSIFVHSGVGFIVVPIQSSVATLTENISQSITAFRDKDYLKDENELLKEENDILLLEVNRLEQVEKENVELTTLLETKSSYPELPTITAKIIGRDNSNWQSTLIIDKGTDEGIEENMIVLAYGGLLGRVVEVSKYSSKITTILDDSSSISVMTERTKEYSLLKGSIETMQDGLCELEYYDESADILVGDTIVTSNISSLYPSGIDIGTVKSIPNSNSSLVQTAIVELNINFDELTTVLVVTELFTRTNEDTETISNVDDVEIDINGGE
ncbi:MAG: rod shape-determining protein MreC [Lachnospirales bacterium]